MRAPCTIQPSDLLHVPYCQVRRRRAPSSAFHGGYASHSTEERARHSDATHIAIWSGLGTHDGHQGVCEGGVGVQVCSTLPCLARARTRRTRKGSLTRTNKPTPKRPSAPPSPLPAAEHLTQEAGWHTNGLLTPQPPHPSHTHAHTRTHHRVLPSSSTGPGRCVARRSLVVRAIDARPIGKSPMQSLAPSHVHSCQPGALACGRRRPRGRPTSCVGPASKSDERVQDQGN